MSVAATVQRKPQTEQAESTPAPVISAVACSPVMPSPMPTPARSSILSATSVQAKRFVSAPDDAAEREADRVAEQVMAMPSPARASPVSKSAPNIMRSPLIAQRAPARAAPRPASQAAATDANIAAEVKAAASGGFALSPKTKAFLQPRFRADFSGVRLHTDATAKRLSNKIGARAFTYGSHIFFNDGQYNPDSKSGLQLLAHELTHTIQQSETIQRKAAEPEAPRVNERTGKQASRLGISDALDYFADAANAIPGYRMFTILIGVNPINMSSVEASAANILRAIVEFLPGGNIITRVLDSYGVFEKVGSWIEGQLKSLGISGASIKAAINEFLDSLGWRDIFDLGGVWNRAKRIFTTPISRIISFAQGLFVQILKFVQEAVLRPLAALAANTPFYGLLKAVLGKDPVTGEPVQGGAAEVIGGFMTMIGQEELWGNIQRANAIPRAWAWFQTALSGLVGLVTSIPTRFIDGLKSLEIMDFVVLPRAFVKIGGVLGSFLADFGRWALGTVFDLLKIIIEVVAPGVMPYIQRAAGAFQTIVRNPVRFIQTLVRAAMQGFRQFAANFLTHLQASLVGWLTGAMGGTGVYIPRGFNLREILKFVLSILGLTWANIRAKLVRATNEATVVALETGFDIVRTLVTEGPAAAWEKILEAVGNLRQMAIDAIMNFVKSRVIEAAVTRLLSMLSPAGAFIQAIIAIYNTIMFFVERLRQIAQVAASFIDAIATIAAGNIGPAANRVETTMAGLLTLVISFLARIAGLGRVADAVTGLIARIRAPIDRGLDRVVAWIVAQARRLGAAAMRGARGAVARVLGWWRVRKPFRDGAGAGHNLYFAGEGRNARLMMASAPMSFEQVLADGTNGIPDAQRTALRQRLTQLNAKIARRADNLGDQAAQDAFQREIEADVTALAADLGRFMNNTADLPVSAVSWGGSSGRAGSVRAEPLTRIPGNTTGSAATGSREHANGFALVSRFDQPTSHTRHGGTITVDKSRVTAAHLLHHGIHGPYEAPWNIVLADQGLNNRMAGIEGPIVALVNSGKRLRYSVTVTYHSNVAPPARAMTDPSPALADVRQWVDFYIASSATITAHEWDGSAYTRPAGGGSAPGAQTPIRGEPAIPVDQQVLRELRSSRVPSQIVTEGSTTYTATTVTAIDTFARDVMGTEAQIVRNAFAALTSSGQVRKFSTRGPFFVRN